MQEYERNAKVIFCFYNRNVLNVKDYLRGGDLLMCNLKIFFECAR